MDNGLTNFRVIQASCDKPFLCPEFPSSRRIATITATPNTKRHNVHHELCFIAVLLHLIFEDCNYKPSRFLKKTFSMKTSCVELMNSPFTYIHEPLLMLTPCRIHHSRPADLQRRSPQRSYHHFGYITCQILPQLPQRPV